MQSLRFITKLGITVLLSLVLGLYEHKEAEAAFGFHAGSHLGVGRMGNATQSLSSRTMSTFDLQFMPGWRLGSFMPGLLLDYRFVSQMTPKSDVGNSDLAGKSFTMGLGSTVQFDQWKLLFSYDFRSRHSKNEANSANQSTSYAGSGFHFLAGYGFASNWFFDVSFSKQNYNSSDTGGLETRLDADVLTHWNLGFGISYSY